MSDERTPPDSPEPPAQEPPPAPAWPSPPEQGASRAGMPPVAPPQWPAPPPVDQQPGPGGVHPLDVGRAFSVGWSLFRFRWKSLLGAALLVMVPAYLLQTALSLWASSALEQWTIAGQQAWLETLRGGRQPTLADLPPFPIEAFAASFLGGILVSIAGVLVAAALIQIIGWTYGGGRATAAGALRATFGRLPSLLGAALLVALIIIGVVFGGVVLTIGIIAAAGFEPGPIVLLAFIIGVSTFAAVIFLGVRWQFYVQAIMLEGAGAIASLGRSWRLVSGSSWRVLGYLLLLLLVLFLAGIVVGIVSLLLFGLTLDTTTGQPTAYSPLQVAGQTLLSGLVSLIVLPFFMAVMTLLYYDLRWRAREVIGPPPA